MLSIVLAVAIWQSPPERAHAHRQATAPAATALEDGDRALARKDWPRAIQAFAGIERVDPVATAALRGLGAAHAGAGHELAATAWLQAWLVVAPPNDAGRQQVVDHIIRLKILAEAKIRRIAQEAGDALDEIGEGDPARTAQLQRIAMRAALLTGDMTKAQASALQAAPDGERDDVWAAEASALAGDEDFNRALDAVKPIVNEAKRDSLMQSVAEQRAAAKQVSNLERWRTLARQLSNQREVVDLDATLQEVARLSAAEVPIRLLAISTTLQAAYARIQRLGQQQHP